MEKCKKCECEKVALHVKEAKRKMTAVGLGGQDWMAAKYLEKENKPDFIGFYKAGNYWIGLPYKNGNWTEDKLAFDSLEFVCKFAKICGAEKGSI